MPSFWDKQNINTPTRKLTSDEIIQATQMAIAAEYETIKIYQQIMGGTDNATVRAIISELTDDTMHHAGALLKLLYTLSPNIARQYEIGAQKMLRDMGVTE